MLFQSKVTHAFGLKVYFFVHLSTELLAWYISRLLRGSGWVVVNVQTFIGEMEGEIDLMFPDFTEYCWL